LFSEKNTYKFTLQLIAEILSFENSNDSLKKKLESDTIDWDQFVVVSSKELVLTTCYCRLEQKQLLNLIPNDLVVYLMDLTSINRQRNLKLIDEIKSITKAFNKNNIDYVLLKGAALLIGNYYKDIGERMVGDVDILVTQHSISEAYQIIEDLGYQQSKDFNYKIKNFRHLPRQYTDDKFAVIELHSSVLDLIFKHLIDEPSIFTNKTECNGIYIPNRYFLNLINIMGLQINSKGYQYRHWFLRTMYDSLVLKLEKENDLLKEYKNNKFFIDYIAKYQAIFNCLKFDQLSKKTNGKIRYYNFKLSHYWFHQTLYKLKYVFYSIYDRMILFIGNADYRSLVLKRFISSPKRI
jgi:hypothetical protein